MALRAVLAASAAAPFGLVIIAPLEGFAFACVFVGGVTVLASRIPASLGGTVQGLFSASAGLATIIGSIAGGTIAGAVGIPALFAACSALGLAGAGTLAFAVLGPPTPRVEARPVRELMPIAPGTPPAAPGSEPERTVPVLKVD
jgi:MFS family permease